MKYEKYILIVNTSNASIRQQSDDDSDSSRRHICNFPFGLEQKYRDEALEDAEKICKMLNEEHNK